MIGRLNNKCLPSIANQDIKSKIIRGKYPKYMNLISTFCSKSLLSNELIKLFYQIIIKSMRFYLSFVQTKSCI
jgi:hypothetical protein